ncbi:MAG: type IX secretion system membrane protein PorP/SprF [Bacteroidetes bacterium]|jgi:type IX secretion system PorP/SprF family membrane protein|nr:type IX secretion system membrane protein PorP/SprF [Bacteroidota bacterium]
MNRIILSLAIMAIGCVQQVFAQQDAMFTHYMFNQVVYNPAFVGAEMGDNFCINLVHHNQWMGYSDEFGSAAPLTTTFNIHKPLKLGKHKLGAGLIVWTDGLGFQATTTVMGALSYHYQLPSTIAGGKRWLIGGINFGMVQTGIEGSKLRPIDEGDPIINWLIANGNTAAFDLGAGLLYKTEKYYVGLSTLHIPQSKVDWFGGNYNTTENKLNRHIYINAGYDYALTDNLVLKPRTLLKFDRAVWQIDLGILAEFNDLFWGGLNVRRGEGIMLLAGVQAWQRKTPKGTHVLKIGASYDISLNKLRTVSAGTFELMANYCFPIKLTPKPPKPEQDVRFLGGYTL